jgi:hypothetical protein
MLNPFFLTLLELTGAIFLVDIKIVQCLFWVILRQFRLNLKCLLCVLIAMILATYQNLPIDYSLLGAENAL